MHTITHTCTQIQNPSPFSLSVTYTFLFCVPTFLCFTWSELTNCYYDLSKDYVSSDRTGCGSGEWLRLAATTFGLLLCIILPNPYVPTSDLMGQIGEELKIGFSTRNNEITPLTIWHSNTQRLVGPILLIFCLIFGHQTTWWYITVKVCWWYLFPHFRFQIPRVTKQAP